MAQLDDLIGEISDPALRQSVIESLQKLRANKRFGLVFEDHIPETVSLPGLPVRVGSSVQRRDDIGEGLRFRVTEIENGQATVESLSDDGPEPLELPVESLHAVRRFGESIYPGLVPVSSVRGGPAERPVHMVLEAENFHAIQLLNYLYSGQVDCLILDPPFNTGDRTWRYSNRYVDNDDRYRHSKWLSFMERRLRLAKRLLKPDGVVIVYIDEHEVHHLGVLMEQIFRGARRQMVTIVNNAAGVTQGGFYRVEEYALFAFLGDAAPDPTSDDMLSDEATSKPTPIWFSLIRYGGVNALPSKRPGLVYPVAIDPGTDRIVATGRTIKERMDAGEVAAARVDEWRPDPDEKVDGLPVVWPYRKDGSLSTWQLNPKTLMALNLEGFVRVRHRSKPLVSNDWSINYVKQGNRKKVASGEIPILGREEDEGALILGEGDRSIVAKTVWKRSKHDAGKWGSRFLREFLGSASFDYPKSPYAVRDVLATVTGSRPDALIVDFFAGSGTTLHSTLMLNSEDGGSRRCILVTNNEVAEPEAKHLVTSGHYPGDPEFESRGVFESITLPRCTAAVTGVRPDGQPVEGAYENGTPYADGFDENVEFFRLEYLDADDIELHRQYEAIAPMLWLKAGGVGDWDATPGDLPWSIPGGSTYAVLFDEARFSDFQAELEKRDAVSHVFFVTDSLAAFAEMRAHMPRHIESSMLYRDYLHNFEINVGGAT